VAGAAGNFIYYLIKKIDKQDLSCGSGAYLSAQWRESPEKGLENLHRFWPEPEADLLAEAARTAVWEQVLARLPELQRALRQKRPFSCRVAWLDSLRKVRRAVRPTGLMVAVVGPEGGAKSAVIEQMLRSLAPAFRRTGLVHPGRSLAARSASEVVPGLNPPAGPPQAGRLSWGTLLPEWFDYTLSYWLRIWPQLAHSTLILLDESYPVVAGRRAGWDGSLRLVRFLGRLIPRPDLWVLLDGHVERCRLPQPQRTSEASVRQPKDGPWLTGPWRNLTVVNPAESLERVVAQLDETILWRLAERTRRQLSPHAERIEDDLAVSRGGDPKGHRHDSQVLT